MTRFSLAAVLLLTSSLSAQAQVRCEGLFASESASSEMSQAVDEMVRFQWAIEKMEGTERGISLITLKEKHAQMLAHFGPLYRAVFQERLRQMQSEKTEVRNEEKREAELDILSLWTREIPHPELSFMGPNLNDSQFFTFREGYLRLYDYRTKSVVWESPMPFPKNYVSLRSSWILSHDKSLLYIFIDGFLHRFDIATRTYQDISENVRLDPRSNLLSKDGRSLYTASYNETRVFDLTTLKSRPFVAKEWAFIESPDGRYILTLPHRALYDTVTGELKYIDLQLTVQSIAFTPDSTGLFIATEHLLRVYDLKTHKLRPTSIPLGPVIDLQLTVDGKYLILMYSPNISYAHDRMFTILDAKTMADVTPDHEKMLKSRGELDLRTWYDRESNMFFAIETPNKGIPSAPTYWRFHAIDLKKPLELVTAEHHSLSVSTLLGPTGDGRSFLTRTHTPGRGTEVREIR